MLLKAIFILTLSFFCPTSALQCLDCNQKLNLESSEIINTARSECKFVDAPYSTCLQSLHVRYFKKEASVQFGINPTELLVLSNAEQIITNTTMIWLEKNQFERTFKIDCFNNDSCKESIMNNIYAAGELLD